MSAPLLIPTIVAKAVDHGERAARAAFARITYAQRAGVERAVAVDGDDHRPALLIARRYLLWPLPPRVGRFGRVAPGGVRWVLREDATARAEASAGPAQRAAHVVVADAPEPCPRREFPDLTGALIAVVRELIADRFTPGRCRRRPAGHARRAARR